MINIAIAARNYEADDKIKDYLLDKIGGLEKYLPRHVRGTAMVQVVLEEDASGREDNRFVCEVILTLEGAKLVSREGTVNMYAAVDIVEAKLKAQVRTYKDKRTDQHRRRRLFSRLLRRRAVAEEGTTEPTL